MSTFWNSEKGFDIKLEIFREGFLRFSSSSERSLLPVSRLVVNTTKKLFTTENKAFHSFIFDRRMSDFTRALSFFTGPPPIPPTKRPIPTLAPVQRVIATVVSKTASTILIIFVSITLITFLLLRVFTPDRVIQMNMEIALLCAHIFLMFPPTTYENPVSPAFGRLAPWLSCRLRPGPSKALRLDPKGFRSQPRLD